VTEEAFVTRLRAAERGAESLGQGADGAVTELEREVARLREFAHAAFAVGDPVRMRVAREALVSVEAAISARVERERQEHGPRRPLRQGQDD